MPDETAWMQFEAGGDDVWAQDRDGRWRRLCAFRLAQTVMPLHPGVCANENRENCVPEEEEVGVQTRSRRHQMHTLHEAN